MPGRPRSPWTPPDGLDPLQGAGALQGLRQGGLEGLPLLLGGHGRLGVEHRVQEVLVEVPGGAGIEEGVIDIGRPVVEGREQEAQLRRGDDLLRGAGRHPG